MANEQTHIPATELVEELARRGQQLEQIRSAYLELQARQSNGSMKDRLMKNVGYIKSFTGTGEVTINSFLTSVEYLLSTVPDIELKREAVRAIYYQLIQGEAKNVVINISETDNWDKIKAALKLRYRPDTEPHQLYRMIANMKVNTVTELAIELQNIKYKADELIVYYRGEHCIDLTNIDSLLVNTAKEMTQGTLLDKIYEERNLGTIIDIMNRKRNKGSCIRWEFKKFRKNEGQLKQDQYKYKNYGNNSKNNNYTQGPRQKTYEANKESNRSERYRYPNRENYNYRENNNNYRGNTNHSGQFQRFQQVGHPRPNSHRSRMNQPRQDQKPMEIEPMEVDNIEQSSKRPQLAEHPISQHDQNWVCYDRQSQAGPSRNYVRKEEVNNSIFFTN